jgi:hypothetical protein
MARGTLDYVRDHAGELLALIAHLLEIGGGIGLAVAGVGEVAAGAATCGEEIAGATAAGALIGLPEGGIGAIPGGAIGFLGGVVACVFTGGSAVAGGIASILGGLAMAMDGIKGAADDVGKLAQNKGPLEGHKEVKVFDPAVPNNGRMITDIDHVEGGVLWEEKTATGAGDVSVWVDKQVTKKLESYLEARSVSPELSGYRDAPIGLRMTTPGVEVPLREAIENAVSSFRNAHPGVTVYLEFS